MLEERARMLIVRRTAAVKKNEKITCWGGLLERLAEEKKLSAV
jgi:hypothetical protein